MKRIYITYCWQDEKYADMLDYYFQQVGIKLIRDKREIDYSSSIKEFAKKMRRGSFNICLISSEYLKRINCMYEINQLLKDDNFARKKFCPIIVDTSKEKIDLSPDGIEGYAVFWKDKLQKQDHLINSIAENRNKGEQIDQLKKIEAIYNDIRGFLFMLKDARYITTSDIEKEGIRVISQNIFKKIGISPRINLEELFKITQLDSIEEAEKELAIYANNHLIKDNEYFLFTKAAIYEKYHYYDLALYNYTLAYTIQKTFLLAYEAIIILYLKGIYKIDDRFRNVVLLLRKIDEDNTTADIADALLAIKEGKNKIAVTLLEKILESIATVSNKEYLYNSLANAYERLFDNEPREEYLLAAEKNYKLSLKENPEYYQALNNLALLYLMKLSSLSKAKQAIIKCLEINPHYHMAFNTLGLIYEEENNFQDALECYMKSYEYSKSYSPPLNQIGRILDFEYKNSLCKLYYTLAYEIDSESLVNCFNLGNYYRKYTDDNIEAERLLKKALTLHKTNILCNMAMGLLQYKIGDYLSARDYFAYAFISNPDYPCGCFLFAVSEYKVSGKSEQLKNRIEEFLSLHNCSYLELFLTEIKDQPDVLDDQIEHIMNEYIEYEYVKTPEQISKSFIINPIIDIHNAYQYIIDNFFSEK